jgi:hypothetical protein
LLLLDLHCHPTLLIRVLLGHVMPALNNPLSGTAQELEWVDSS